MTWLTVESVGGWGDLLTQVGRGQEGRASLDEALSIRASGQERHLDGDRDELDRRLLFLPG